MVNKPFDPAQATRKIKEILKLRDQGHGEVRLSNHVQEDIQDPRDWDHDVAEDELENCLRNGKVVKQATWNKEYDEWTYSVEYAYDTCDLIGVTAFISENVLRVITRYKQSRNYDRTKPPARKPRKKNVSPEK